MVQETETGLRKSLSVSSGKTKCCSSICSIGKATLTSTSNGSVCAMETSCASLRVSHSTQCSYQEAFGMVGQQVTFHLGCNTETVSTNTQSFHGCEPSGWGAHLEPEGLLFHGAWTPDQSFLHIYVLEMKAILLALKQCHQYVFISTVMIATDNSSVVSYLKREGGTHSPSLCMEVWETLQWCNQKEINLLVRHIPGKSNILADRLSLLSKPIRQNGLWIRRFATRFCR